VSQLKNNQIDATRLFWSFQSMITASQCRAARGLLNWTQQQLADVAHIGVATVRLFESEAIDTRRSTLALLRQAFELAGVEFTNGDQPGVRLIKAAAALAGKADTATKQARSAKTMHAKSAKAKR
jgi:transcriptional regulator with XRE-family HTH domain